MTGQRASRRPATEQQETRLAHVRVGLIILNMLLVVGIAVMLYFMGARRW